MSTIPSRGTNVALNLPRLNLGLLTLAKAIYEAMLNNPNFPSPNPPLAVLAADIAALEDAETKAASKGKGAAALCDAKRKKVKSDLTNLRNYVHSIAEAQATPEDAAALIQSVLMSVRKAGVRQKPELSAKNTSPSGSVVLEARTVASHASYYWEHSLDQQTWTRATETLQAKVTLTGLTSAQTYYFRFRALTRAGQRDYSQVVSLLVH